LLLVGIGNIVPLRFVVPLTPLLTQEPPDLNAAADDCGFKGLCHSNWQHSKAVERRIMARNKRAMNHGKQRMSDEPWQHATFEPE
jgi:hypothetical protein